MTGYEIVVMGSSLGGLQALARILGAMPGDFPLPMVIVQHRSASSMDAGLPAHYDKRCELPVRSITDKEPIEPGTVYLAPPDYHTYVEEGFLALSIEDRVSFSRPSIDVLFESAADCYGPAAIGVILTGGSKDGAEGLRRIKENGGFAIVQDPGEASDPIMPLAALALGPADEVLSLDEIGMYLVKLAGERS